VHSISELTLWLGVLNAARCGAKLSIQISDDLLVVRICPSVVISNTSVVVVYNLLIMHIYFSVVVANDLFVDAVDSVNFTLELLLSLAYLAFELIGVECCHDLPFSD
jgi:hypothetical protein